MPFCNLLFYLPTIVVLLNKVSNLHHYFMVPVLVKSLVHAQVADIQRDQYSSGQ